MATPFDYANEINKQMSGTYDNEPFREVTGVVQETGGSAIHLMTTVGVIVVTIALIIAGIKIASGNKRSREEGKEKLLAVVIAAAALFALASVFLLIQDIAKGFMK